MILFLKRRGAFYWIITTGFLIALYIISVLMVDIGLLSKHNQSKELNEYELDLLESTDIYNISTALPQNRNKSAPQKLDPDVLEILNALNPNETSIGLVLQVFTRNSLSLQLEFARNQTLKPRTKVVFQNGFKIDVSSTILKFREQNPDIEVQHIASSKNYRFHGRFFITQMMTEDYVSVWDDDIEVRSDFLRYCVAYSYANKHALVGRIGITLKEIRPDFSLVQLINVIGKNDLVGHTWTLPRVLLRYYIQMTPLTFYTGEDIQIAYALQRVGIESIVPPQMGERLATTIKKFHTDKSAHFRWKCSPRYLLFCKLFYLGFTTVQCKNCNDTGVIETCIRKYFIGSDKIEQIAVQRDRDENDMVAFGNATIR